MRDSRHQSDAVFLGVMRHTESRVWKTVHSGRGDAVNAVQEFISITAHGACQPLSIGKFLNPNPAIGIALQMRLDSGLQILSDVGEDGRRVSSVVMWHTNNEYQGVVAEICDQENQKGVRNRCEIINHHPEFIVGDMVCLSRCGVGVACQACHACVCSPLPVVSCRLLRFHTMKLE